MWASANEPMYTTNIHVSEFHWNKTGNLNNPKLHYVEGEREKTVFTVL
jgi:hypothetical protein